MKIVISRNEWANTIRAALRSGGATKLGNPSKMFIKEVTEAPTDTRTEQSKPKMPPHPTTKIRGKKRNALEFDPRLRSNGALMAHHHRQIANLISKEKVTEMDERYLMGETEAYMTAWDDNQQ